MLEENLSVSFILTPELVTVTVHLTLFIGVGSSCRVYRAVEIENGREVAIKQMILEKQRSKQLTLNEICALKHLKSEKIIPLYGVYYSHCDLEGKFLESVM